MSTQGAIYLYKDQHSNECHMIRRNRWSRKQRKTEKYNSRNRKYEGNETIKHAQLLNASVHVRTRKGPRM
jgi:hypothetical protein